MIRFKPLTTEEEWAWLSQRAHPIACADTQGIIAYDERGIQAGAAFDSFTVDACSVHLAIDNPFVIRRGFLSEVCRHLFISCGRKRIFGLVPSCNADAYQFDAHIGLHEVARIPDAVAEGVDYIVMRMDKADCRWIPEELRSVA